MGGLLTQDSKVLSWWDYGYQIAALANRSTVVDNNTWNASHIGLVGRILTAPETEALPLLLALDVAYVMVVFGGLSGYGSDDINKMTWMLRVGGRDELEYLAPTGELRVSGLLLSGLHEAWERGGRQGTSLFYLQGNQLVSRSHVSVRRMGLLWIFTHY